MQLLSFDTRQGQYAFQVQHLTTSLHAHPAAETIRAFSGTFSLALEDTVYTGLTSCHLIANTPHAIHAPDATLRITLTEATVLSQDTRIITAVDRLRTNPLPYTQLLADLCTEVHLSASRLSHLFRQETGISLRRYNLWRRLCTCMYHYITQDCTLSEAGQAAGFYDQAHLTRVFRQFMGVVPSEQYNSRIVQG